MTARHYRDLIRFNTRMSMFIGGPLTRESIVSYLHGYHTAAGSDCDFLDSISALLLKRHGIVENNWGWWGQLQSLADKHSLDWLEAYYLISFEVLGEFVQPKRPRNHRRRKKRATKKN
jgi:hypothetical protein